MLKVPDDFVNALLSEVLVEAVATVEPTAKTAKTKKTQQPLNSREGLGDQLQRKFDKEEASRESYNPKKDSVGPVDNPARRRGAEERIARRNLETEEGQNDTNPFSTTTKDRKVNAPGYDLRTTSDINLDRAKETEAPGSTKIDMKPLKRKETSEERSLRVFGNSGTKDGSRVKDSPMDDPKYRERRRADQNRPLFNRIFQSKVASSRVKNMDGSYVEGDDYRWNPLKNKDIALGGYIKRGDEAEKEEKNVNRRTIDDPNKLVATRRQVMPTRPKVGFDPQPRRIEREVDADVTSKAKARRNTGGRRTTRKKGAWQRTTFESISLKLKIINENK